MILKSGHSDSKVNIYPLHTFAYDFTINVNVLKQDRKRPRGAYKFHTKYETLNCEIRYDFPFLQAILSCRNRANADKSYVGLLFKLPQSAWSCCSSASCFSTHLHHSTSFFMLFLDSIGVTSVLNKKHNSALPATKSPKPMVLRLMKQQQMASACVQSSCCLNTIMGMMKKRTTPQM